MRTHSNRSRSVGAPHRRHLPPEILSDAEVRALMDACRAHLPAGLRNRALIALLYRSGLRVSEALALRPKDIDLADGSIRVLRGKGGRSRTVGLDPAGGGIVSGWLETRATLGLNGRSPIFCTLKGGPLGCSYVRVMLKRLARKADIEKRVHAHGLRHTHASQLRAEGIDIGIIARQLGHASITTTARYLDHIAPRAVIQAMRARVWTPSADADASSRCFHSLQTSPPNRCGQVAWSVVDSIGNLPPPFRLDPTVVVTLG